MFAVEKNAENVTKLVASLRQLADILEANPETQLDSAHAYIPNWLEHDDQPRPNIRNLVKAFGKITKEYSSHDADTKDASITFKAKIGSIEMSWRYKRTLFCSLVQEPVWQCDPILEAELVQGDDEVNSSFASDIYTNIDEREY